jgi:hypothetical protein
MADEQEEFQGTVTITVPIAMRSVRWEHVAPEEVAATVRELMRNALSDAFTDPATARFGDLTDSVTEGAWTDWS